VEIKEIPKALEARYGRPERKPRPILECLIRTILSQNTNDRLRDQAYERLTEAFGSWEDMRRASPSKISEVIKPAGLHDQKSKAIKALLELAAEHGYDLSFLCKMKPRDAYAFLLSVKGIGDKTAKVCLLFSCGMPFFPVDTHISRVAKRLGLAVANWTRERVSQHLSSLFDPADYYSLHLNLIELGRELCKPSSPRCDECPINRACRHARERS